ncbi:MAG TPA: phenylalanine--tRNA ligase subunit beta [Steroidobacteraceae bacterium]|nr:phenylalanine--tRNA ligase subunit beta [Steroidobacteraceae bacterium]
MKTTYRWLQEFAALAVPPAVLAEQLTLAGLEVEAIAPVAPPSSMVVVGEVLSASRHPQADKLTVCEVTTDGRDRLQIICGAANVRAGLKVAVATEGAQLPGGLTIKRTTLRGLESQGMLCSARELGLGEEHDGILELAPDLAVGQDLRAALDLDDWVLEVKATPNRGDCMSTFGIARDYVAARERRYLSYHTPSVPSRCEATWPLQIDAPQACPIFAGRAIRAIRTDAESPPWLRERLRRIGINSISPVVDVTNYVMAEIGQPMHAYDLARLNGAVRARWAASGERLTLLDDKEYLLDPECLVIADASGAIGLAGIMGGRATAISATTTEVFLEAAHFSPVAIAGRARRLGLFTDAAQRFERGVDPGLPPLAIERATALLLSIVGGEPGPVQLVRGADGGKAALVTLRRSRLQRLLGATVPDLEVEALLVAVAERVEPTAGGWRVTAPGHRFDLAIEEDLVEEVARLRGFDSIAEAPAIAPQRPGSASELRVPNERLITALIDRGYREAITYSFVDPTVQQALFPDTAALRLANPISAELSEMRVSLWPGLLQACRENLRRQQTRVRLFEIGRKYELRGSELHEIETLAGVVTGARLQEQWGTARAAVDFYDVKADLESLLGLARDAKALRFEAAGLSCLHPGRSARIFVDGAAVGWLGELHPQAQRSLNFSTAPLLFELEIESAFACKLLQFKVISKFPSVRRDLAVVVDESLPLAVLLENVNVSAAGLLSELRVFDIYRGSNIDLGRKSVALGLILQDSSRTLTDIDADAVMTRVVSRLRDELSATIRDE